MYFKSKLVPQIENINNSGIALFYKNNFIRTKGPYLRKMKNFAILSMRTLEAENL